MKQYLLSVHAVAGASPPTPEVMQAMYAGVDAFNRGLQASGAWVFAGGLEPPDVAKVISADGDEPVVTDGPRSDSTTQLGGFWVVTAPDLDAALDLARQASAACRGPVEVRPFQDVPEE